jgi:hypothetical protein
MSPTDLTAALSGFVSRHQTEAELCDALEGFLGDLELQVEREARLGPRERIDFLVQTEDARIGVEVKCKGGVRSVTRQLGGYAASDGVDALILVTTKPSLGAVPRTIGGIPIYVATMLGSCFV